MRPLSSVWRDMCDRFYPQEERVRPEKMIQHLNELGTNEVVELLWFAVVYCDRWCEGKYEELTCYTYVVTGVANKI